MPAKTKAEQQRMRDPLPLGCPVILSVDQVCQALQIGRTKLDEMVATKRFPPPDLRIGVLLRWKPETVRDWIERETEAHRGVGA